MKHIKLIIAFLILSFFIFFGFFYYLLERTSSNTYFRKTPIVNKDNNIEKEKEKPKEKEEVKKVTPKEADIEKEKENTQEEKPVQEPKYKYSCPDGFILENDKCLEIIDAEYTCPINTIDYTSDDLPRDTYCVNLDDGFETYYDSCPENYGIMSIVSPGQPTIYKCLVLYNKFYTCEEDFVLNGSKCIKKYDAEIE